MTFEEMKTNLTTLVFAGSETTATLLSGCTYQLLSHPQIYEKVKAEIRGKFNTVADINMSSVQECEYMLAVLEESLRIYPPAPSIFNRMTPEDTEISGVKLPKGTLVGLHQLSTNRSSENWRTPYEFIPERFTKEGKEGEFRDDGKFCTNLTKAMWFVTDASL
jgi:cytochrome P450